MKNLKLEDFTKAVSSTGYVIFYKNRPIGGAGITGKNKSRESAKAKDRAMYHESADIEISGLVKGIGSKHLLEEIELINTSEIKKAAKLELATLLSNIPYIQLTENEMKIYLLLLEDEQLTEFSNEIKK